MQTRNPQQIEKVLTGVEDFIEIPEVESLGYSAIVIESLDGSEIIYQANGQNLKTKGIGFGEDNGKIANMKAFKVAGNNGNTARITLYR